MMRIINHVHATHPSAIEYSEIRRLISNCIHRLPIPRFPRILNIIGNKQTIKKVPNLLE